MPRFPVLLLAVLLFAPSSASAAFLEPVDLQIDSLGIPGLAGVLAITVSPDGRYVYSVSPSEDAIAVFRRDSSTGSLAFASIVRNGVEGADGLGGASDIALSPDGAHAYVASSGDNAVVVLRRDAASGALTYLESHKEGVNGVEGLGYARGVTVSHDGAHVYVAGQTDGAIVIFARNTLTGTLKYAGNVRNGVDGIDSLASVLCVALSPDGSHLYAAAGGDGALSVFRRHRSTGKLTLVDVVRDDGSRTRALAGTHAVTVSPDGAHVYATGQADDALAVFKRDARSGKLTLVDVQSEGADGVRGLYGALALAVSPNGEQVYATGSLGNSVAVFQRDRSTGVLTFLDVEDAATGVNTLAFARSVAVSPDGRNVYVGGASSNAVTAFRVNR